MNSVVLIGRLTRDPEVRYSAGTQMAICRFAVAIDRPPRQNGEKQADFPNVVVFERFLAKGRLVGVQGRSQTGSYTNKDGATVYTTEVVADRVEFLEWGDRPAGGQGGGMRAQAQEAAPKFDAAPEGFSAIDEDIPF